MKSCVTQKTPLARSTPIPMALKRGVRMFSRWCGELDEALVGAEDRGVHGDVSAAEVKAQAAGLEARIQLGLAGKLVRERVSLGHAARVQAGGSDETRVHLKRLQSLLCPRLIDQLKNLLLGRRIDVIGSMQRRPRAPARARPKSTMSGNTVSQRVLG